MTEPPGNLDEIYALLMFNHTHWANVVWLLDINVLGGSMCSTGFECVAVARATHRICVRALPHVCKWIVSFDCVLFIYLYFFCFVCAVCSALVVFYFYLLMVLVLLLVPLLSVFGNNIHTPTHKHEMTWL